MAELRELMAREVVEWLDRPRRILRLLERTPSTETRKVTGGQVGGRVASGRLARDLPKDISQVMASEITRSPIREDFDVLTGGVNGSF